VSADPLSPFLNVEYRPRKGKAWLSLQDRVKSAIVTHTGTRKSSKIEIVLDNEDQSLFANEEIMRKGTPIRFTWGYPDQVVNAGNFVIKSHKPSRTDLRLVCLEGKRSSMTRRTVTFTYDNVRRSDVVRVIAKRNGFDNFIVDIPPHIGTLTEKSLHAALKEWLSRPDDRQEVRVDGFVIDIVRGDTLIEIQTRNFGAMKRKLAQLLSQHPIHLNHPIAVEKWIVRQTENGDDISRRKSPKRGRAEGCRLSASCSAS